MENNSTIHANVEAQLKKSQVGYKAKRDKHRVPCNFGIGDLLWLEMSKKMLKAKRKKFKPL